MEIDRCSFTTVNSQAISEGGAMSPVSRPRPTWTLVLVCAATFMLLLDISVVTVALPQLREDVGATFADAQWVFDAYTVMLAGLVMAGAALADRLGRRAVFVGGLALFTVASAVAAASQASLVLVLARGVQGAGGALLLATAVPLLADAYPARGRATALGIWGATIGAATAVGPLVGGLLTDAFGWRSIFLVNVPIGLLAAPLARRLVLESRGDPRPLDALGLALLTGGLIAGVFAIVRGGAVGWDAAPVVLSGAAALGALTAFVAAELRLPAPMLDLRLLATPNLAAATVSVAALAVGLTPVLIYLAVYFQGGLAASPSTAGLFLLPATVTSAVASAATGRLLLSRLALPAILAGASALVAAGLALMTLLDATSDWIALVPGLMIAGIGWGTINPAAAEGTLASVPASAAAMASGIIQVTRQIGIAVGVAALGALFHAHVEHALGGAGPISDGIAAGATHDIPTSPSAPTADAVHAAARHALAEGINTIALVGAAICALAAIAVIALTAHARRRAPHPEPATA
jgi:EmrB/QacA subfamily drug resistance transporter